MKTSILQSMLARNKEVINNLNLQQEALKEYLQETNSSIKSYEDAKYSSGYLHELIKNKYDVLKDIQKNSKSLKQLAAIQKAIKEEIKFNNSVVGINLFKED
jgi:glutaredoxin 2